jgi:gliding motility-associated transport system ATP-binding protein
MIRAAGLVKHYGDVKAVDDVSFEVGRGELVGFLGPNGAGKSTTMKMLTGYLYPDAGEVEIAGHPMDGQGLVARANIGYLPEHTPLYREMRVDRYLAFVASVRGLRGGPRRDAVERVIVDADLEGYTTRRIRNLSKGYRQRVGLAQALIADPDVLILDEPTSGLDPAEIVRIRERIVRLATTKTVLLSTHVLGEVEEVCPRAIIIAAGRIIADGSLAELATGMGETLAVTLAGTLAADGDGAAHALGELAGVTEVNSVAGTADRVRFHLTVEGRFDVAERVSRLAVDRGWVLLELSHEVPTLERVFLARVRALAAEEVEA